MKYVRFALVVPAVALVLALAGCYNASNIPPNPTTGSATGSEEASETAAHALSASQASANVALGAELQHSSDWTLVGETYVTTVNGQPTLSGNPAIAVTAVRGDGVRFPLWSIGTKNNVTSQQGVFSAKVPAKTTTIVITTGLTSKGATGTPPALVIPLGNVPQVATFTVQPGQTESF